MLEILIYKGLFCLSASLQGGSKSTRGLENCHLRGSMLNISALSTERRADQPTSSNWTRSWTDGVSNTFPSTSAVLKSVTKPRKSYKKITCILCISFSAMACDMLKTGVGCAIFTWRLTFSRIKASLEGSSNVDRFGDKATKDALIANNTKVWEKCMF